MKKNSFLFGFSIVLTSIFFISTHSYDKNNAPLAACFAASPVVRVCDGSGVTRARVDKALSAWVRLGYSFQEVIYNDDSASCSGAPEFGDIVITRPDEKFDYKFLAITNRTSTAEEGMIVYSIIYIQRGEVNRERVLEHEIGHALGWDHSLSKYHLMYEEWVLGGWSISGIRNSDYSRMCSL
jgi:hypothetical protein